MVWFCQVNDGGRDVVVGAIISSECLCDHNGSGKL